jgi:hypothetical protein
VLHIDCYGSSIAAATQRTKCQSADEPAVDENDQKIQ